MKKIFSTGKTLPAFLALGLLAAGTFPRLSAQTQPEKNVDELEKQIQALRQSLDDLRRASTPTNGVQVETPRSSDVPPTPARRVNTNDPVARIREEGMNHSQVMQTLSYLSDVIGARLTGSPNMKHANEWTRDTLTSWGLTNAHLEAWGPFGRGWELKRFSAQVIAPQDIPLKAYPNAWTTGFDSPVEADVVYLDARSESDLDAYKGKLRGAIVLASPIREPAPHFESLARRLEETNLLEMADANVPPRGNGGAFGGPGGRGRGGAAATDSTNGVRFVGIPDAPAAPRRNFGGRGGGGNRFLPFLAKEGVAMVVNPSSQGDGGTIFVASATVTPPENQGTNNGGGFGGGPQRIQAYSLDAPSIIPQMTVAVEDYNRLIRMIQAGEKLRMAVDLKVKFQTSDPMAYNTIAEIPGTDLKNELVMLGGHMDSWQSGTGATDNGAGVAVAMEAVRILKALDLKPRRTIRIALWSGEEEGLLGSRAYVSKHFGYYTNEPASTTTTVAARSPREQSDDSATTTGNRRGANRRGGGGNNANRKLIRGDEYDKLSVYFNLDNGAGRIRGIYMQGNEGVRPLFRKWLDPFRDLGAATLTAQNTGSTDHVSFDNIGLPGFQFIQDPLEYNSRTHHSNEDVFDRVPAEDMKQCATIMAAFVYQAAMLDDKLPKKPAE